MKTTTIKKRLLPVLIGSILSFSVIASMPPLTDTNGDGVISADEITAIRDAHRAATMGTYDTDGDGKLSRMEKRAMKDARYESMLQLYDADGNGELSRTERRAAHDARRDAVQLQLDVNQDGEVSDAERAGFDAVAGDKHGRGGKHDERRKHRMDGQGKYSKERHDRHQDAETDENNQGV